MNDMILAIDLGKFKSVACIYDAGGTMVDSGRVPIDAGYMAVLKALRDQFNSVSNWREDKEFDLVPANGEMTMGRAGES